jgi:hypothetical protein
MFLLIGPAPGAVSPERVGTRSTTRRLARQRSRRLGTPAAAPIRCAKGMDRERRSITDRGCEVTAALSGSPGRDGGTGHWPPNLLARIAATIGRRRQEDVASTALLYVIQADNHARRAVVADLARRAGLTVGADLPDDLSFAGQDRGEGGRPDIVGVDDRDRARVVIEAKIDAGFQPDQIARYSGRLASDLPSVIAVLAPERRLPRLLHEAHQQLIGKEIELAERGPVAWQTDDRTLTLLGFSWLAALEAMENVTSSADLGQLRGF